MSPDDRDHVRALIRARSYTEARTYLLARRPEPETLEWLSLCADVETGDGKLEVASALYDRILEEHPEHEGALYNASLVLSDLGRHEDAMVALETLVEVEGESAEVLNDLSFEYAEAEHNVPALLAAARAESLAEDEDQRCLARLNVATALANMGRGDEAVERLDAMLAACTGACGEREAAQALRSELDAESDEDDDDGGGPEAEAPANR